MSAIPELAAWLNSVGNVRTQFQVYEEDSLEQREEEKEDQNILPLLSGISLDGEWSWVSLTLSISRSFEGYVRINEKSLQECEGTLVSTDLSGVATSIVGLWQNGRLEGSSKEQTPRCPGWTQAVYRRGVLHGVKRVFNHAGQLSLVASYVSGRPVATLWKAQVGGGYLVGPPREEKDGLYVSGQHCVYIFPDLAAAMEGEFRRDRLVSGRMADLVTVLVTNDGMATPVVRTRHDAKIIRRDVSSNKCISMAPLTRDEWEDSRVRVSVSTLGGHAGQGLFAARSFERGELLALFNGVRLQSGRDESLTDYKIRLNGALDLDIPVDMTCTENYRATLGHKVNHAFGKAVNSKWTRMEHPRFGLICAVAATRHIEEGEEILVDYGLCLAEAPDWYKSLFVQYCRGERGMTDEDIDNWCHRKYTANGRYIELPLGQLDASKNTSMVLNVGLVV